MQLYLLCFLPCYFQKLTSLKLYRFLLCSASHMRRKERYTSQSALNFGQAAITITITPSTRSFSQHSSGIEMSVRLRVFRFVRGN